MTKYEVFKQVCDELGLHLDDYEEAPSRIRALKAGQQREDGKRGKGVSPR